MDEQRGTLPCGHEYTIEEDRGLWRVEAVKLPVYAYGLSLGYAVDRLTERVDNYLARRNKSRCSKSASGTEPQGNT